MFSIVFSDPFSFKKTERFFNGVSIYDAINFDQDIINSDVVIGYNAEDGIKEIPKDLAKYIKPKKGQYFVFIKPKDSDTARIALTVALIAGGQAWATNSAWVGSLSTFGAGLVNAGIAIGATYLASAIIPYSKVTTSEDKSESSTLSITGASNTIKAGYPVPHLIGTHKFAPPKAMQPITESQGKDSYLTEVFCLGIGPMDVKRENIEIGDTQIDSFTDFEIEIKDNYNNTAPITLVTGDVNSQTVSATFNAGNDEATRTSSTNTEELSVEIAFPALVKYNNEGKRTSTSCSYSIFYKNVNSDVWIGFNGSTANASNLTFRSIRSSAIRYKDGTRGQNDRQVINTGYGITSYIDFNDGLPSGFAVGTRFNVYGTSYNSKIFEILSLSGNTALVGRYELVTLSSTQEEIRQYGNQTVNESNSDAYVGISTGSTNAFVATDATSSTTYRTHTVKVDKGQYDVKVIRNTAQPSDTQTVNSFQWTQLKSTQYTDSNGDPIKVFPEDLCYIAIKIKATDQLNGAISNLFVKATSIALKYDPIAQEFTDENGSGNPAWEYLNILLSPQAKRQLVDEDIEIDDFVEWAEYCDEDVVGTSGETAPRFRVNMYMDYETSTADLLNKIASIGRASRRKVDYKESILVDRAGKIPVMHLSPANIMSFTWNKSFVKRPDAYLMSFASEQDDYEATELLVKRDDSIEDGDIEYIEDLDASGITNPDQVYRYGKFAIAQVLQRPETYTVKIGINSLQFLRGDVIKMTHDRVQGVTCFGTVLAVNGNVVTVDNPFNISNDDLPLYSTFSNPESYEQSVSVYQITNINGNEITFLSLPSFDMVDGQYAIGSSISSITRLYVVKSIQTADDLVATFQVVDYAEDTIFESEDNVSGYVSGTVDLSIKTAKPPVTPKLINIKTDESVIRIRSDGTMEVRAKINLEEPSNDNRPEAKQLQVFYRPTNTDALFKKLVFNVGEDYFINDLEESVNYDIKFRYISEYGVATPFVLSDNVEIIGKTSLPPDVTEINYDNGLLSWSYNNPPVDLAGFKVRYAVGNRSIWEEAEPLHEGVITATNYDVSDFVASINSFFVKAVDTSGNLSEVAAKGVVSLGEYSADNIVTEIDKFEDGWPDVISNGYIDPVDGYLYSDTGEMYLDDSALFYGSNSSALFYQTNNEQMSYEFTYTVSSQDSGAGLFIEFDSTVDGTYLSVIEPDTTPMYSNDSNQFYGNNSDIMFPILSQKYRRFNGAIQSLVAAEYKFKVTIPANRQPISRLNYVKIIVDVEDIEDVVDSFLVVGGEARLPLTKSFREIRSVLVTLQDNSNSAVTAKIVDKNNISGPLIRIVSSLGSLIETPVDAVIKGY